jgi:type III restriction enzyme
VQDEKVRQKQLATVEWCTKINLLPETDRMARQWEYVLLSKNHFYSYAQDGVSLIEICELAKISEAAVKKKLFS